MSVLLYYWADNDDDDDGYVLYKSTHSVPNFILQLLQSIASVG